MWHGIQFRRERHAVRRIAMQDFNRAICEVVALHRGSPLPPDEARATVVFGVMMIALVGRTLALPAPCPSLKCTQYVQVA